MLEIVNKPIGTGLVCVVPRMVDGFLGYYYYHPRSDVDPSGPNAYYPYATAGWAPYLRDPVGADLYASAAAFTSYDFVEILTGSSQGQSSSLQITGREPVQVGLSSVGHTNWTNYVNNAVALFRTFEFTDNSIVNRIQENEVHHFNLTGKALNGVYPISGPSRISKTYADRVFLDEEGFIQASPPQTLSYIFNDKFPTSDFSNWEDIVEVSVFGEYWMGAINASYLNPLITYETDTIIVSYDIFNSLQSWRTNGHVIQSLSSVTWTFELVPKVFQAAAVGAIPDIFYCNLHYEAVVRDAYIVVNGTRVDPGAILPHYASPDPSGLSLTAVTADKGVYITDFYETVGDLPEAVGYSVPSETLTSHRGTSSFQTFVDSVEHMVPDLHNTTVLATNDAIDKYISKLESNHLETLSEFSQVLGPDQGPSILKVLGSFSEKRFRTFKNLLNALTSATLIYEFGIRPTFSDAETLASQFRGLQHKYKTGLLFRPGTANGIFQWDFPLEQGDPWHRYLTARSKVRLSYNDSALMIGLLSGKSAGLSPSLGSVWDILPGSFILDWFFPVGDYGSLLDNQLLLLMLDVDYVTTSISVDYRFTSDRLQELGASPNGSHDPTHVSWPGYRMYTRYIRSTVPVLGPTRLSYMPKAALPSWRVGSSVIYKKLS